jgi:hypothetical protein
VKSFDRANREIGAPGNRFLPLKMGMLWRAGVLTRLKEKTGQQVPTAVFRMTEKRLSQKENPFVDSFGQTR